MKQIPLEIKIEADWTLLGHVEIHGRPEQGHRAATRFYYHEDYLLENMDALDHRNYRALSLGTPLNFGLKSYPTWHPYLLDILPNGAARQAWQKRLGIERDGPSHDLDVLYNAPITPPGNVRVQMENRKQLTTIDHPGFSKNEIIDRGMSFIDYAEQMGAMVSGFSGAGGMAPKFLLVKDKKGQWHGDQAIEEKSIAEYYIVKYPRGKTLRDKQILEAEASYMDLAEMAGLKTDGKLEYVQDTLFIKRFDRNIGRESVEYYGLESLCSALEMASYTPQITNNDLLKVIAKYSSDAEADCIEFILRDFLNIAYGNNDNHARNTSFIKKTDGSIRLSPVYDFAPMAYDPEGIPRAIKWQKEKLYIPDMNAIEDELVGLSVGVNIFKEKLDLFIEAVVSSEQFLSDRLAHHQLIEHCTRFKGDLIHALKAYRDSK